jgi:hypothetical protein
VRQVHQTFQLSPFSGNEELSRRTVQTRSPKLADFGLNLICERVVLILDVEVDYLLQLSLDADRALWPPAGLPD